MGTALPSQVTFPRLALKQKMFRLGRAKINNYVIREFDKGRQQGAEHGVQVPVQDCHGYREKRERMKRKQMQYTLESVSASLLSVIFTWAM